MREFHIFLHFYFVLRKLSYLCNCLGDLLRLKGWTKLLGQKSSWPEGWVMFALAADAAHSGMAGFFT